MGRRAHRLSLNDIQRLCDFFAIDRSIVPDGSNNKFALVNLLLDFLSVPMPEFLKSVYNIDRNENNDSFSSSMKGHLKEKYNDIGFRCCLLYPQRNTQPPIHFIRRWMDAFMMCHNQARMTIGYVLNAALTSFCGYQKNDIVEDILKKHLQEIMKEKLDDDATKQNGVHHDDVINDNELRKWIDSYLICYFCSGTLKHAHEMALEKFGSRLQLSIYQMKGILSDELHNLCTLIVRVKIRFTF